jgi:hypothetical protein
MARSFAVSKSASGSIDRPRDHPQLPGGELLRATSIHVLFRICVAAGLTTMFAAGGVAQDPAMTPTCPVEGAGSTDAAAPPRLPFGLGEHASYRVSYNVVGRVGTGTMSILGVDTIRGRPAFHALFTLRGPVPVRAGQQPLRLVDRCRGHVLASVRAEHARDQFPAQALARVLPGRIALDRSHQRPRRVGRTADCDTARS